VSVNASPQVLHRADAGGIVSVDESRDPRRWL